MHADSRAPAEIPAAARLCLDCGLCCNGVLFDHVRLQPGDNRKALTARGLKIKRGGGFNQPCTALCGTLCQLYAARPTRCRQFECRQYRLVTAGEISHEAAAARIAQVKGQVAEVEKMLVHCGSGNVRKPLAQRYATALELNPVAVGTCDLSETMGRLQMELDEHFRPGS